MKRLIKAMKAANLPIHARPLQFQGGVGGFHIAGPWFITTDPVVLIEVSGIHPEDLRTYTGLAPLEITIQEARIQYEEHCT